MDEMNETMNETVDEAIETPAAEVEATEVEAAPAEVAAETVVAEADDAEADDAAEDAEKKDVPEDLDGQLLDKLNRAARLMRNRRSALEQEAEVDRERNDNLMRALKLLELKPTASAKLVPWLAISEGSIFWRNILAET